MNACCFTGHREIPADQICKLRKRLEESIHDLYHQGVATFYTGGALGFDSIAAETVIDCRRTLRDIHLITVVPCKNQEKYWQSEDIYRYYDNLSLSDDIIILSNTYYPGCMQRRNRYMVDHSSVCICYQIKKSGGTAYTVQYAQKRGLKIYNLA